MAVPPHVHEEYLIKSPWWYLEFLETKRPLVCFRIGHQGEVSIKGTIRDGGGEQCRREGDRGWGRWAEL